MMSTPRDKTDDALNAITELFLDDASTKKGTLALLYEIEQDVASKIGALRRDIADEERLGIDEK
jgi:hypothetical protein